MTETHSNNYKARIFLVCSSFLIVLMRKVRYFVSLSQGVNFFAKLNNLKLAHLQTNIT